MSFSNVVKALRAEAADRDYILISHPINRELYRLVSARVARHATRRKCTVFLTTYGGDPHAAFRIGRCLQHHFDHVRVCVLGMCKSAGTLIAVAAHQLAFGDQGELGPLDLQFTKASEVLERETALDYMQGMNVALTHAQQAFQMFLEVRRAGIRLPTAQAGEIASRIACGVVAPLYQQIDPNRIGEMQRGIKIAQEYGARLSEVGKNLKDGALDRLVAEYPSHSFVIDRKEARTLFKIVETITPAELLMFQEFTYAMTEQVDFCHVCEDADVAEEPNEAADPEQPAPEPEAGAAGAAGAANEDGGHAAEPNGQGA